MLFFHDFEERNESNYSALYPLLCPKERLKLERVHYSTC